jgi:hypothetical protein
MYIYKLHSSRHEEEANSEKGRRRRRRVGEKVKKRITKDSLRT